MSLCKDGEISLGDCILGLVITLPSEARTPSCKRMKLEMVTQRDRQSFGRLEKVPLPKLGSEV